MGGSCGKNKISDVDQSGKGDRKLGQFTSAVPHATASSASRDGVLPFDEVYDIGELLGSGSFGGVHRATRKSHFLSRCGAHGESVPKEVAVKVVIQKGNESYAEAKRQIKSEYSILSNVHHAHIIHAHELFAKEITGDLYLVIDLCQGGEIIDVLALKHPAFTETEAASICRPVLSALEFLHKRDILHRLATQLFMLQNSSTHFFAQRFETGEPSFEA